MQSISPSILAVSENESERLLLLKQIGVSSQSIPRVLRFALCFLFSNIVGGRSYGRDPALTKGEHSDLVLIQLRTCELLECLNPFSFKAAGGRSDIMLGHSSIQPLTLVGLVSVTIILSLYRINVQIKRVVLGYVL